MKRHKVLRIGTLVIMAFSIVYIAMTSQVLSAAGTDPQNLPLLVDSPVRGRSMELPAVVRHRFVTVNHAALSGNSFSLSLFDSRNLTVVMDTRQDLRSAVGPAAADGFVWTGHVQGLRGSLVMVVATTNLVSANIALPGTSHVYVLQYAGDGVNNVHALYDIDRHLYPPGYDRHGSQSELPGHEAGVVDERHVSPIGTDGGSAPDISAPHIMGLLAVSTSRAITEAGGFSAISQHWYTMVAWTNEGLKRSRVNARLQIMAIGGVNYTEVDGATDGTRFWTCGDGWMDEICDWRTQYGGDLAQLVGHGYGLFGMATLPGWGSITDWKNLVPADIPAHEIGHSMCAGHDRREGFRGCWEDSYGYIDGPGNFGDIMSYRSQGESLYPGYSNPDVFWPGVNGEDRPTGIRLPSVMAAHNTRVMNYMAPIIAGWK